MYLTLGTSQKIQEKQCFSDPFNIYVQILPALCTQTDIQRENAMVNFMCQFGQVLVPSYPTKH